MVVIAVAEELLDGPDVVTALQEMGGQGMAEGVAIGALSMPSRGRRGSRRAARSFRVIDAAT